jgi:chromosome segregation protein
MSQPARLLAVRLQGFKSFALRTAVEFGPGISAVIGPNGAGKSNLADALRWAFGEQGRALRSRRSEDMIFAGSEGRPAVGMADVSVDIDNADGLLPMDYRVVQLGRRLFRSGENEYLLNGTRVRLRDLEELLDVAHLADNAFLFIGQGMVDQALALRPEERRPLFEEVAGVRRHERRKRAAQDRLVEAEANLARVRDVIAELRPQARRLAGQARQQAVRLEAAIALADAVVAAGRAAWHEASTLWRDAHERRSVAQAAVDVAIAELRAADDAAAEISASIEDRSRRQRAARSALDAARGELQAARLAEARATAQREALDRERQRVREDGVAVDERIAAARRELALPLEVPPGAPIDAVTLDASPGSGEDDVRSARDRLAERRRALAEEDAATQRAIALEAESREALDAALGALAEASEAASAALGAVEAQRRLVAAIGGRHGLAEQRLRVVRVDEVRSRERMAAIDERLRLPADAAVLPSAEPLAAHVSVEAALRAAVEGALGAAADSALLDSAALGAGPRSATFVLRDVPGPPLAPGEGDAVRAAAARAGGGHLVDAVRDDPSGVVRRLLARAVWVPDLGAALRVAPALPPGWTVTTATGDRLGADGVLEAMPATSRIALRDERAAAEVALADSAAAAERASGDLAAAAAELEEAEKTLADRERSAAELDAQRRALARSEADASRRHELAAREAAWARAQQDRRRAEVAELEETVRGQRPPDDDVRRRVAAWNAYWDAVRERQRLEGTLAADVARSEAIASEEARTAEASAELSAEGERLAGVLAPLEARVAEHEAAVAAIDVDEGGSRDRQEAAERQRRSARERLHAAEAEARATEVAELEARMALDAARERLLVELAVLGLVGLVALGGGTEDTPSDDELDGDRLERALEAVVADWSASPPPAEVPSDSRLAALRRRYHELGAVNPFAAEEHAEISARLTSLESQRDDLERAIAATRELIGDLERLIAEQFQATFRALETAFERRFNQLFGGGEARLSLTDPADPAASGVEIVARPPGKKAQPLAMLSGGERALTAVALLFAMLEVRPVPFCVLDEVDAALDEANIGRFAAALRELADTIQFIVITHNRGTIEEADALYGVTIGEDAVSRVISLRLEAA